ncbi:hypothetical protein [Colwellia sp. BRX8-9]|uniref:hypothetical protein n=1 Tax=Colwellia sp. BRX8-9 TaxID=2759831 RepID=UPI0015F51E15|nr:hypothetical protein [Colwellia sp. BRX8-9]MBA6349922.1 hypothetical protein [Colwellia sp. BRX8-9]
MNYLKEKFGKFKPRYLSTFDELIKTYAQFGGGSVENKFSKAKAFSSVYEFYMFAFFLGLNKDKKLEITDSDLAKGFWEVENWKPVDLVEQLFVCAIAESDFDMVAIEHMDESQLKSEISKVLRLIEDYANGGLLLIKKEMDDDEETAVDDLFFIKLLAE